MPKTSTLAEMLEEQVQDLYNAENQGAKALTKMAKKASTPQLKQAFLKHAEETKNQAERLKQVAQELGVKPTGKVCKAMQGLVAEGEEAMEEGEPGPILDAMLIASAQRVEHYEIAGYGTAATLAEALGENKAKKLLGQTLEEEKRTDVLLTQAAEQAVYPNAMQAEEEEGEEEEEAPAAKRGGRAKAGSRR